jgi:hypothetical protein
MVIPCGASRTTDADAAKVQNVISEQPADCGLPDSDDVTVQALITDDGLVRVGGASPASAELTVESPVDGTSSRQAHRPMAITRA